MFKAPRVNLINSFRMIIGIYRNNDNNNFHSFPQYPFYNTYKLTVGHYYFNQDIPTRTLRVLFNKILMTWIILSQQAYNNVETICLKKFTVK